MRRCIRIGSVLAIVWTLCTLQVAKNFAGKAKVRDAEQRVQLAAVDGTKFQSVKQKLPIPRRIDGRLPSLSSTSSNKPAPVSSSHDGIKVLSFSVYGLNRRYLGGMIRIAMNAPKIYPGWQVRVYHPPDLFADFKVKLDAVGDHVKLVDVSADTPQWVYSSVANNVTAGAADDERIDPTMWRFLVASDPTVSVYAIRDCDSVLSLREKAAVDEWLASGKKFHLMHDHALHHPNFLAAMLAGMWGGRRDAVPQMDKLLKQFHSNKRRSGRASMFGDDQLFLWQHIVPLARNDCVHHDSYYCDESGGIAFPMTRIQARAPYDYIGDAWFNLGKGGSGNEPSADAPWAQKCLEIAENKARYQHCLKKRQDMEDDLAKMSGTKKRDGARFTPSSSYAGPSEPNISAVNATAICHLI
mmetsp:Transcript_34525/g.69763  ORF Transcript_34525/g.69763 Transcript_34525/m.69763 type:complete len:412 (-) Transcript_34525:49-1284(-)|eukprot:CAMPEP_0178704266 /NCGR_PEP_ID=MMETSP0699-20121125/14073_1 /TAXON_ID=265572 /ORGANISM="Extubocellulus spinifer, Strain CCMP396" /LENGTH=411 /DNA_ID=CAMNT_0020351571 /DNA_START=421 /DNA_END=1656 /DNA_ORIENTATION=+